MKKAEYSLHKKKNTCIYLGEHGHRRESILQIVTYTSRNFTIKYETRIYNITAGIALIMNNEDKHRFKEKNHKMNPSNPVCQITDCP